MSIELRKLTAGYSSKILAKDINLKVNSGELIALIGPNGVGKSTLLKTIVSLNKKINGEVLIDGIDIEKLEQYELARKISVLLTEKVLIDYLTVAEMLELGTFPYQFSKINLQDKRVNEIKSFFNLNILESKFYNELSDGQKQRALLARAAVQSIENMVLDEPTTYLDILGKTELFKLLKRLTLEKKSAVLISTHDLELAGRYVDKFWVMSCEGTIIESSPNDFFQSGLLKEIFGL